MKRIFIVIPVLLISAIALWSFKPNSKTTSNYISGYIKYTPLSIKEAKELISKADLPSLISSNHKGGINKSIYNGFLGSDHYRIEFYIDKVTADADNPYLLRVDGKTRYKKKVTDIVGEIHIDSLLANIAKDQTVYQAKGTFKITEMACYKNLGEYSGKICLDFADDKDSYYLTREEDSTRGGQLLMEGNYSSFDGKTKNLIAARNLMAFANDILDDFYYGGRSRRINSKYRALGWDDYWQNDEWWAVDKTSSM